MHAGIDSTKDAKVMVQSAVEDIADLHCPAFSIDYKRESWRVPAGSESCYSLRLYRQRVRSCFPNGGFCFLPPKAS